MSQSYGIGIESEGYFMTTDGKAVPKIEEKPSSEYIIESIEKKYPKLRNYLSVELPSVVLEVKSDVASEEGAAVKQILEIREIVNQLLPPGIQLIFTPVCGQEYEFIPSTSEPNSRAHQLIQEWGTNPEGQKLLYASAICSFQINDSRIFTGIAEIEEERYEIARKIHNLFGEKYHELCSYNSSKQDFFGKKRMESYHELMKAVKGDCFMRREYSLDNIVIPPYFRNKEAMWKWMCAHSDVESIKETQSKNEHAATVKIKRGNYWAVETRIFDSVETEKEMLERMRKNTELLKSIAL